ncbi:MAG: proton-conducting transporter membrane subunit [Acidimicrobiales bacterium]
MTVGEALLLAGLVVIALGGGLDLALGAERRLVRPLPYLAALAGSGCLVATGVLSVLGPGRTVDLGGVLDLGRTSLRLDHLAGLFLTLTFGLGVLLSACLASWVRPPGRAPGHGLAAGYALLLGSVAVVVVAGDAFTFLFGWETLSVSFYVLAGVSRARAGQATASWATLGIGKGGGALLLFGFLLLAGQSHSLTLAAWHGTPAGAVRAAAYALVVGGFGAKVGLVPFQVWMPVGYPRAPGPVRAAMAGLAVNAGFYGLWRFLGILGAPPVWLVALVLVLGGVTALLGIVFAAVQADLDRVIAYSSVENAGVILVGYGVALAGAATHDAGLVAVGLLAATLQVVAHAVAKSGLFAAASNVEADYGTSRLERLSGVRHTHPWSSVTFTASALTLAGLPPTIGFASEWFILEALMQQFRTHLLILRLSMAAAGALVALTAGVAALTFARLIGLAILGRRPDQAVRAGGGERGALGRSGLALLAASCLGLAAGAPYLIRYLAVGLTPVVAAKITDQSLRSPWVLQPVFKGFSILSPSWAFVVMPVGFAVVTFGALVLSKGRLLRVRRVPAWRSATGGVAGPDAYTAFGYANVARHVLGNVLGSSRALVVVGGDTTEDPGSPGPPADVSDHVHLEHQARVVEPIETYLYGPARRVLLWVVRRVRLLQSGRLEAYMAYMLVALVAVLAVAAALR